MTDTEKALAFLREQMGEGWLFHFVVPPNYTDRMYAVARLPGRRVPDVAVRVEGECMPDPMSAARACVEAWREATAGERAAMNVMQRERDMAYESEAAERAHADRLAEALRNAIKLLRRGMAPAGHMSQEERAALDGREALAAHDARRAPTREWLEAHDDDGSVSARNPDHVRRAGEGR